MLRSKSMFAILLALSSLLSRAQAFWWDVLLEQNVIGYATVPTSQALRINEDNKLYVPEFEYRPQLGPGIYLVNEPGSWQGDEGSWYCAIKARRWKMNRIKKVFIPKTYLSLTDDGIKENQLWGAEEGVILEYIKMLMISKPAKALRFSWVKGIRWQLQMAIPKEVVEKDDLDLWAQCFESEEELFEFSSDIVNFEAWTIAGDQESSSSLP
ncbi:hypothetical protein LZ554_004092 [Drepanopeziza brunnea f. sp. 'monogermtubi']|nr:hypothetical protein LZ554_004092 [Drepanopeziza brunnea f. sp. 'monogermtubi']